MLDRRGRYAAALRHYGAAGEYWRQRFGTRHPQYARALVNRGIMQGHLGHHDHALALISEGDATYRAVLPPDHPVRAWSARRLAVAQRELGNMDAALEAHQVSLAVLDAAVRDNHVGRAKALGSWARTLCQSGRAGEGLARALEASQAYARARATVSSGYGHLVRGECLSSLGQWSRARLAFDAVERAWTGVIEDPHPSARALAQSRARMAQLRSDRGEVGRRDDD